jgi:RNA polymerase I-specific transcription initiation factor RRN7
VNVFLRAIEAYDLPYLDSTRYLPADMSVHLNRTNVQALSPPHAPKVLTVHTLCARLARRLNVNYGVFIPEVNAAPVLSRVVRAMHGPPILYSLVKRLAFKLCLPLTLHNSLAPDLEQSSENSSKHHKYDNIPPELSFMVVVVMVLKMMYGLDGKAR